jgi:hypothetical protein
MWLIVDEREMPLDLFPYCEISSAPLFFNGGSGQELCKSREWIAQVPEPGHFSSLFERIWSRPQELGGMAAAPSHFLMERTNGR